MSLCLINILRLCLKRNVLQCRCYSSQTVNNDHDRNIDKLNENFIKLYKRHKDKITFSSYIDREKIETSVFKYHMRSIKRAKEEAAREFERKSLPPLPIALQYYLDESQLITEETDKADLPKPEKVFQLPFSQTTEVKIERIDSNENLESGTSKQNIDKWMTSYEHFDDTLLNEDSEELDEWDKHYGTPDPNYSITHVQCGGCGALLHCNDPAIPGYLPSEIIKGRSESELKTVECQRCHFLKEYNIALDVNVQPHEYEKLLNSIRHVKSLVVLMVDLLDFPCSIWPDIVDIIGTKRPIILVGNKVDLLPGDSVGYLKRIYQSLLTEINKTKLKDANIKNINLISAKTGYGIENLISAMFKVWLGKGDVFLVGCTNVGKSSLFNALLQSDYCKVHAVDIIRRATVSKWPGTTLNLLKFPINRPSGWKIYQRSQRLNSERKLLKIENEIRNEQLSGKSRKPLPTLIGHIGRTFSDPRNYVEFSEKPMLLDENDKVFAQSKWFYDTPGIIHPDQVLSLLTTEELLLTIPRQTIKPQTYYLAKGSSIFIAGLARIDFLDSENPCRFTIFCSNDLPITVTKTEDADIIYKKFLGTELLGVPEGAAERLKNWPGLQKGEDIFEFNGEGPNTCCGDIVLSSIAWVAVSAKKDAKCTIAAWTPVARGIHKRCPSLLPYSVKLKGKRIVDTPAYRTGRIFSNDSQ